MPKRLFTMNFGSPGQKRKLLTILEVTLMKKRTAIPKMSYVIFLTVNMNNEDFLLEERQYSKKRH